MTVGLQVSRLINVQVNLAPTAAQAANLNSLLIMGDSDVIDTAERLRSYNDINSVATDFGTTAPEYLAAQAFFAQSPQPTQLYIGRWAQSDTKGLLKCGALSTAQKLISNFTAISDGSLKLSVDGTLREATGINLSAVTNLNAVAAAIQTALTTYITCVYDGSKFVIKSKTTGAASAVLPAVAPSAGTDLRTLINATVATGSSSVQGIVAETALAAVTILDGMATYWYGLMFASTNIVDADHVAIAGYIEAAAGPHVYGVSSSASGCIDSGSTSDIASLFKTAQYKRSFVQYSQIAYAVASWFGRVLTTDFNANNSVITLMYKQEPGVTPETLTASQADTLINKRCNFYVNYNNGTAILQNGVMSGPYFFDEVYGTDWLANALQTNLWNLLYQTPTKIPQTDAGTHLLVTTAEATCAQGVNNGLLAPGTWTTSGFGTLAQGDFLPKGYYVYAQPVANQNSSDRAARKSVPIQVAAKLAGAIHSVNVIVNVNR